MIFKLPAESADAELFESFINETHLILEVAITDTPRQSDPTRREKFEGTVVYTTVVSENSERTKDQIDSNWVVIWDVTVPISFIPGLKCLMVEHGRTKNVNPRVALTAILSLNTSALEQPKEEEQYITSESWDFLAGQSNLLAPLAGDPALSVTPVLSLTHIVSSATAQTPKTKPGRRICRHIFPCGSPLDIRMRYNPLEPDDSSLSVEIVLLSVDLSVTPHAGAPVLVKEINVEMGGGTISPLQAFQPITLNRYDVMTVLFRYERYGGDGGRKAVSTTATMIPLLSDSEETSPKIISLWNKVLDVPSVNPSAPQFTAPTRAVSQVMNPASTVRHAHKASIVGKPQVLSTAHGRAQTNNDGQVLYPPHPSSIAEVSNLSITVQVPSEGVKPNEKFMVDIQVVNRLKRPIRLALQVNSGQAYFQQSSRLSKADKILPQTPVIPSAPQVLASSGNGMMTERAAKEFFLREQENLRSKPIIALTVEAKFGFDPKNCRINSRTLMPGQVQSIQSLFLAVTPGIHEITGLRIVEIPSPDTPTNGGLAVNLTSCPSIIVHGDRY